MNLPKHNRDKYEYAIQPIDIYTDDLVLERQLIVLQDMESGQYISTYELHFTTGLDDRDVRSHMKPSVTTLLNYLLHNTAIVNLSDIDVRTFEEYIASMKQTTEYWPIIQECCLQYLSKNIYCD